MKFENIEEYIKKSKDERTSHLDLNDECILIGGHSSTCFKGLLAHYVGTTIPKGLAIQLCHACFNGQCSNPKHLYWGTAKENAEDRTLVHGTIWEARVRKIGLEKACEMNKKSRRLWKYSKSPGDGRGGTSGKRKAKD